MVVVLLIVPTMQIAGHGLSALRPKALSSWAGNRRLREVVASKTDPGLVARRDFRLAEDPLSQNNENMHVSHETIYRSLFIQARGVLKERADGPTCGRSGRMRRSRHAQRNMDTPEGRSSMPSQFEERTCGGKKTEPFHGHWEGDLLAGGKKQLHCDVGGAAFTLPHADQGAVKTRRWWVRR